MVLSYTFELFVEVLLKFFYFTLKFDEPPYDHFFVCLFVYFFIRQITCLHFLFLEIFFALVASIERYSVFSFCLISMIYLHEFDRIALSSIIEKVA